MSIIIFVLFIFCSCGNREASIPALVQDALSIKTDNKQGQSLTVNLPKEQSMPPIDGTPLLIDDFKVFDVHGYECYFPGKSVHDVIFQLGYPMYDGPIFSKDYREYLALPVDDEERKRWNNEFACCFDGLSCQYYDKEGLIYIFHITGSRFMTLRGLTIGDSKEKVLRLYGQPAFETDPGRAERFLWLPADFDKPWKILTYSVDPSGPWPDHRYFGPGATYHFFIDENDRVEFIYATGED